MGSEPRVLSQEGAHHPGDDFFQAVLLEGGLGTSGGPQKPFQEVHKVKTIFLMIVRCYLPFSLAFCHECTVEFSKS